MSLKKSVVMLAVAAGLFLAVAGWSATVDTKTAAAQAANPSQICRQEAANFEQFVEFVILLELRVRIDVDLSHGACVALLAADNFTPLAASLCQNADFQEAVAARNRGECVNFVKSLITRSISGAG